MKFHHPLMHNNFSKEDFYSVKKLFKHSNVILTQSSKVKLFEKKWSKWLGVKYSTFVNSGSSANFITISLLEHLKYFNKKKNEIIVPALTWSSDIISVIKNNYKPIFVDIDLANLSMNENEVMKKVNKKTLAVFITHAQGFCGFSEKLIKFLKQKKIMLIEDVCESHGATLQNKKLGTFGEISNFSFYYAHHMSTIEGGMICTNDKSIYELSRVLRSHGLAREMENVNKKKIIIKNNPDLSPNFIFLYPGFNMRNNEIGGVLGISQLKRLDNNVKLRKKNFQYFLENIDEKKYFINFKLDGNSNYAFPIILKKKSLKNRKIFEDILLKNNIEFRRGNAGGGNQLRQPYLKKYLNSTKPYEMKNTEHVHFFGYYIGNYPTLKKNKIKHICEILNNIPLED